VTRSATKVIPAASTLGGVPEQPLDFVDGGGDVFDVRVF
jgi:hypothetical protein